MGKEGGETRAIGSRCTSPYYVAGETHIIPRKLKCRFGLRQRRVSLSIDRLDPCEIQWVRQVEVLQKHNPCRYCFRV